MVCLARLKIGDISHFDLLDTVSVGANEAVDTSSGGIVPVEGLGAVFVGVDCAMEKESDLCLDSFPFSWGLAEVPEQMVLDVPSTLTVLTREVIGTEDSDLAGDHFF